MDLDAPLHPPGDPLALVLGQDLDPLSVDELSARIAALEGEIARCRARMGAATSHRAAAEDLFKR